MIRIEADAIQSAEHEMLSAPIRLITNQSKIRVTLKRRVGVREERTSRFLLIIIHQIRAATNDCFSNWLICQLFC